VSVLLGTPRLGLLVNRRIVVLYTWDALRQAHSWQLLDCVWKAAAGGICVRYDAKSCDPIAITAQNGLRLQLVTMLEVPPANVLSWGVVFVPERPQ